MFGNNQHLLLYMLAQFVSKGKESTVLMPNFLLCNSCYHIFHHLQVVVLQGQAEEDRPTEESPSVLQTLHAIYRPLELTTCGSG